MHWQKQTVQTHAVSCHCYHKRMHRGTPECFHLKCQRVYPDSPVTQQRPAKAVWDASHTHCINYSWLSGVSYYREWQRGGQEREETGKMAEHKAMDQCSEQADNNITYKVEQQMDGLWWQHSPPGATTCLVFSTRKGNFIKVGYYTHRRGTWYTGNKRDDLTKREGKRCP